MAMEMAAWRRPMLMFGTCVVALSLVVSGLVLVLSTATDKSPDFIPAHQIAPLTVWGGLLTLTAVFMPLTITRGAWRTGLVGSTLCLLVTSFLALTLIIESVQTGHGGFSGSLLGGDGLLLAGTVYATMREHNLFK